MNQNSYIDMIGKDIETILMPYLAINSESETPGEKDCEIFLTNYFNSLPYFQKNRDHCGNYFLQDDLLGRAVSWALVKGEGADTVVLLHHHDVVGVEDFKDLSQYAFSPELLEKELMKAAGELHSEAREDLFSGEFLFGRGTADMKGGGAIQLSLLKRYSETENFIGNVVLISVPDEENLSAGMRAAADLLTDLKEKFGLNYHYVFNSEPHQRKEINAGVLSEGSVGKILAFAYCRGYLSHVGKVYEGLNPLALLSEFVVRTELSLIFSDSVQGEAAPPPTWLYLRDGKESYDVSMPLSAFGCISILSMDSGPKKIMHDLERIASDSFDEVIRRINESHAAFCKDAGLRCEDLPWKSKVVTYSELLDEAVHSHGDSFLKSYQKKLDEINRRIKSQELNLIESSSELVEFVFRFINDLYPRMVLGFVPPYYPNVSNHFLENRPEKEQNLAETLSEFCLRKYGHRYDREYYFTGISDLSYFAMKDSTEIKKEISCNMPLYGPAYSIPFDKIGELTMPCMNIGPWGKDLHKLTERVNKKDLYERTPAILDRAIRIILNHDVKE